MRQKFEMTDTFGDEIEVADDGESIDVRFIEDGERSSMDLTPAMARELANALNRAASRIEIEAAK